VPRLDLDQYDLLIGRNRSRISDASNAVGGSFRGSVKMDAYVLT